MKMQTTARRQTQHVLDFLVLVASASLCFSVHNAHADARRTSTGQRCITCAFITPSSGLLSSKTRYTDLYSVGSSTDSTSENSSKKVARGKRGKGQKNINVQADLTPPATPPTETVSSASDEDFDELFAALSAQKQPSSDDVKLVDFIEQNVGIQTKKPLNKQPSDEDERIESTSQSTEDDKRQSTSLQINNSAMIMEEQPPPSVTEKKGAPYNVVCTHITADFDTLASAIGLAKLWSMGIYTDEDTQNEKTALPTYVVLPRGAHPDVSRFLSLHKHLFPIRSLKSLPGLMDDTSDNVGGLQRVGLVDAQRRDRLGPADILLDKASKGVTIVDHHVDAESDIDSRHYIVENVGSVSTMIAERLKRSGVRLTEAEATVLALGIHGDTGSLVYDSTVRFT